MPKKGHSGEQIIAVLRQVEARARVEDVCRKGGDDSDEWLSRLAATVN